MSQNNPSNFDHFALAHRLAAARERITAEELQPVPENVEQALAVQDALVLPRTDHAIGWKVARSPSGEPVAGRMTPMWVIGPDAAVPEFTWRSGAKIEAEIVFVLASDLPPRATPYSREELKGAIGAVHFGLELVDSRIENSGNAPYYLLLADRLGNAGYAVGPQLPAETIEAVAGLPLDVTLDGTSLYCGPAGHPTGNVLDWFETWANNPKRSADTLTAGTYITTGSLCGAPEIPAPGLIRFVLDGRWTLESRFV